jgi:hypothetical protein
LDGTQVSDGNTQEDVVASRYELRLSKGEKMACGLNPFPAAQDVKNEVRMFYVMFSQTKSIYALRFSSTFSRSLFVSVRRSSGAIFWALLRLFL